MRFEVHRATVAHPGIWSSIGADTDPPKEASKFEAATSISLLAQHRLGRAEPLVRAALLPSRPRKGDSLNAERGSEIAGDDERE